MKFNDRIKTIIISFFIVMLLAVTAFLFPKTEKSSFSQSSCILPQSVLFAREPIIIAVSEEELLFEQEFELFDYGEEIDVSSRGADRGDYVYLQYSTYASSGECLEKDVDYSLELGSNDTLDSFQQKLYGTHPNESLSFQLRFPEDYPEVTLQGKLIDFEVKILRITRMEFPELTDEFLQANMGYGSYKDYRDHLWKKIYDVKYLMQVNEQKENLLKALTDQSVFDETVLYPEVMKRFDKIIDAYEKFAESCHCSIEDVYENFETSERTIYENALYAQKKAIACNELISEKGLMPTENQYSDLCEQYVQSIGYINVEEFVEDNGEACLREDVNEIIVKDYLFSISTEK